jgi:hypothetical protein
MIPNISLRSLTSVAVFASLSAFTSHAQTAAQRTALASTVSIGDALHQQDQKVSATPQGNGAKAITLPNTPPPVHLLYVHGMNQTGPDDSAELRNTLCRLYKACATPGQKPETIYAEGPFSLTAAPPTLTYLDRPIWSSPEEWHASAPFIHRFHIFRNGRAHIVLDEINWYPLVYPLKCKFLLPGDARLTGSLKNFANVCLASKNPDGNTGRFLTYPWPADPAIFATDLSTQHAPAINHSLKLGVMDWGFGDAVIALGPMSEILTAAIRQLLLQSMRGLAADDATDDIPVFFVTHSLGSYLALAAIDTDSLGALTPQLNQFQISPPQAAAADFFTQHTTGFYFLANQIGLLSLARLVEPAQSVQSAPSNATPIAPPGPVPPVSALTHYANLRQSYINRHPESAGNARNPQIIAWSADDDLLSWYVPNIPNLTVINLPARNSSFRLPGILAWPTSVHDNYAENKAIVRIIFNAK